MAAKIDPARLDLLMKHNAADPTPKMSSISPDAGKARDILDIAMARIKEKRKKGEDTFDLENFVARKMRQRAEKAAAAKERIRIIREGHMARKAEREKKEKEARVKELGEKVLTNPDLQKSIESFGKLKYGQSLTTLSEQRDKKIVKVTAVEEARRKALSNKDLEFFSKYMIENNFLGSLFFPNAKDGAHITDDGTLWIEGPYVYPEDHYYVDLTDEIYEWKDVNYENLNSVFTVPAYCRWSSYDVTRKEAIGMVHIDEILEKEEDYEEKVKEWTAHGVFIPEPVLKGSDRDFYAFYLKKKFNISLDEIKAKSS